MEEELTRKQRREQRRQEKIKARARTQHFHGTRRWGIIVAVILIIGGIIGGISWLIATGPKTPEEDIIARAGMHWHPELSIFIKGEKQEIPADIGIGAIHKPIHTHDDMGVLHLEFPGIVRQDDVKLGEFFKTWGKKFNSECILEFCNGPEGTVKFSVSGKENNEFDNYSMKDGDKLEIRYE